MQRKVKQRKKNSIIKMELDEEPELSKNLKYNKGVRIKLKCDIVTSHTCKQMNTSIHVHILTFINQ